MTQLPRYYVKAARYHPGAWDIIRRGVINMENTVATYGQKFEADQVASVLNYWAEKEVGP